MAGASRYFGNPLQKYKKKCSHENIGCILVMNRNDTLYFGNKGVVIAAMFGNGLCVAIVCEVPLFES